MEARALAMDIVKWCVVVVLIGATATAAKASHLMLVLPRHDELIIPSQKGMQRLSVFIPFLAGGESTITPSSRAVSSLPTTFQDIINLHGGASLSQLKGGQQDDDDQESRLAGTKSSEREVFEEDMSVLSSPFLDSFQEEVHNIVAGYRAEVRSTFRNLLREIQSADLVATHDNEMDDEMTEEEALGFQFSDGNAEAENFIIGDSDEDEDSVIDRLTRLSGGSPAMTMRKRKKKRVKKSTHDEPVHFEATVFNLEEHDAATLVTPEKPSLFKFVAKHADIIKSVLSLLSTFVIYFAITFGVKLILKMLVRTPPPPPPPPPTPKPRRSLFRK